MMGKLQGGMWSGVSCGWGVWLLMEWVQIELGISGIIISTSMAEKTVEQKIKECKELIIQNMEKTIQHKMVYMFLKDRKKQGEVKQYSVNGKDGIIKIQFIDHDKAEAFYNEANFNDKILIRPFNIYFNLTLSENEMKKYYLEGITEQNQRKLFQAARKIGICKLYTSYGNGARAKLKSNGLLSFIRKDPINDDDFNALTENLKAIGIKINTYVQEKGMKVSLNLINFLSDQHYDLEETMLQDLAESTAKDIMQQYIGNAPFSHLSVLVKKKEIPDPKDLEKKIKKVLSSALFEYSETEATFQHYEKVRVGLIKTSEAKVKLFFHNEQNNSYLALITQGLNKPVELSEKQFQQELIKSFREINPNVLQVNIYPVIYNNSYIGRVYLRNEEEGRNFLVDYSTHRSKIYQHYKEKLPIFNINIDAKTLRKLKQAERKAKETEEKIKKQSEANRRDNRRPANQMALPANIMVNSMMPSPISQPAGLMMPPMGGMAPPMGDKGMMIPPQMYRGGPADFPPNFAKMGMGMPQPNVKVRVNTLVRDKQRFIDMEENAAKRAIGEPLRLFVEEQNLASGQEAAKIVNVLIKDRSVANVLGLLQAPDQFRDVVLSIKNNQN